MSATPEVITRYFEAADEQDFDALAACFTEDVGETGFNVGVRIEGDFPGGTADLVEAFRLRDGLIEHLAIG